MTRRAVVVGAGGAVGETIALLLLRQGWRVVATMRRTHDAAAQRLRAAGAELARFDLDDSSGAPFLGAEAAVLTPILDLSLRAAPALRAIPRVVAFSSNNVALDPAAPTYRKLAAAEAEFKRQVPTATILRPTLIYGDPRLPALTQVMRWARRVPVLPVPGSGRALQQPVFVSDLAECVACALDDARCAGATFALGGPDIVSMRALFASSAAAVGAHPRLLPTPRWALEIGARVLGRRFPFDAAQIARVELDRIAAPATPLPGPMAPRTPLHHGLAELAAALRVDGQ